MMQEFDFHWIIFSLKFKCLPVKLIKFTGEFLAVCKKRDYSKVPNKRVDKINMQVGIIMYVCFPLLILRSKMFPTR